MTKEQLQELSAKFRAELELDINSALQAEISPQREYKREVSRQSRSSRASVQQDPPETRPTMAANALPALPVVCVASSELAGEMASML